MADQEVSCEVGTEVGQNIDPIRFANTCTLSGRFLSHYRANNRCCCLCIKLADIDADLSNMVVFYAKPEGLIQHCRVVHSLTTMPDNFFNNAEKLSKEIISRETLRNICGLSAKREKDTTRSQMYKKCLVTCEGEDEIQLFATSEKEAAKLFSLYVYHKDLINPIEDREHPLKVKVKSPDLEIHVLVWRTERKFYLETCFTKLVS